MNLQNLVTENDLTGRPLRQVQREALEWVQSIWGNDRHIALSLPVGTGKSLIARAVQLQTKAAIVTPNNALVQQYIKTYPSLPHYIGKTHYKCESSEMVCSHKIEKLHFTSCSDCPYVRAKEAGLNARPCVFNPMSLFHAKKDDAFIDYPVIVVDEAHAVINLLKALNSEKIPFFEKELREVYGFRPSDLLNELYLVEFLKGELTKRQEEYDSQAHHWNSLKKLKRSKRLISLENIIEGLTEAPENYAYYLFKSSVEIKCVKLPRSIVKKTFGRARLVVLSATLFKPDLRELFVDEHYDYLDLPSPIDKARRPVFAAPLSFPLNHSTDPVQIAAEIDALIKNYPGINTLVHMPYSLAAKVVPFMETKVFTHTSENKDRQLKAWQEQGGVFVGSGIYDGIDLKDDLCRLNIIVKIPYPNLGDILVQKRKALKDGDLWYAAESLKAVIQSVGRSTRGEEDYSDTYVLDPSFARLVAKNYSWLPESFTESIVWGKQQNA